MSKILDMRFSPAWKNKYVARVIKSGHVDMVDMILDESIMERDKIDVISKLISLGIDVRKIQNIKEIGWRTIKLFAGALYDGLNIDDLFDRSYSDSTLMYLIKARKLGYHIDEFLHFDQSISNEAIRFAVILKIINAKYDDIIDISKNNSIEHLSDIFEKRASDKISEAIFKYNGGSFDLENIIQPSIPYTVNALIDNDLDLLNLLLLSMQFTKYPMSYDTCWHIYRASKDKNFKEHIDSIEGMIISGNVSMIYLVNLPHLVKHNIKFSDVYTEGDSAADVKRKIDKRIALKEYLSVEGSLWSGD